MDRVSAIHDGRGNGFGDLDNFVDTHPTFITVFALSGSLPARLIAARVELLWSKADLQQGFIWTVGSGAAHWLHSRRASRWAIINVTEAGDVESRNTHIQ